ncbi:J domain-containing protein required for chloroplast accumulation response 1 isoform X1 [Typha angustifolia]|uniref:J domain-containing protein required for chloroplast accumulation response 1 isoform X1 n=1 Tax=Typha angustifolia TaxID=59011 RepID=UPI003C2C63DE
MEKILERDHTIGYSKRSSDVDFQDVFGGPPRRPSLYERRRSLADPDSFDSHPSSRERGIRKDSLGSRRQWSGLGEKPVFGEINSPIRRRNLGDDFYSDIFPGSDSSCSTPKRVDRDVFSSSPGSRVLSPSQHLPPSLSMKLAKGIDQQTFGSPTRHVLYKNEDGAPDAYSFPSSPYTSMSNLPTRPVVEQDDLRNDTHGLFRYSSLSRLFSRNGDKPNSINTASSLESQSQRFASSLESYINSSQFHFSIYKWAGKGVSLILPYTPNERSEKVSGLRGFPEVVIQGIDLLADDDNISTNTGASKSQTENEHYKLRNDVFMQRKDNSGLSSVEDTQPAEFERMYLRSEVTKQSGTHNDINEEVLVAFPDKTKSKLKNLHQLFKDGVEKLGSESMIRQDEDVEGFSGGIKYSSDDIKSKEQEGREIPRMEEIRPNERDTQKPSEDKVLGTKVKGKVKEFIRIFNTEGSPKRKPTLEARDQRSTGKSRTKNRVEHQVSASDFRENEEVKTTQMNDKSAFPLISSPINEALEKMEKEFPNMSYDVHRINDLSPERNETFESCSADAVDAEESHFEDLEECLVEQLSDDQDQPMQNDMQKDQIKISDSKIREWSKGKEGNIRSLLSTLQHILWPESGWKPVPLVNIIEGASVKRAYQKALLCLHPDKLQQRGAAMHQKYIAEKVFDILQEAWTEFNSLGSF